MGILKNPGTVFLLSPELYCAVCWDVRVTMRAAYSVNAHLVNIAFHGLRLPTQAKTLKSSVFQIVQFVSFTVISSFLRFLEKQCAYKCFTEEHLQRFGISLK